MRLDSLMNTAVMNTLTTMSTARNVVTGQSAGWGRGDNTSHYSSYQPSQRPRYAGIQAPNRGIGQYMGRAPWRQPLESKRPLTVTHNNYIFNIHYVSVRDVKSAQVGVHVNSGHGSMNNGNHGNYGNNGNGGAHSRYENRGQNGNEMYGLRVTSPNSYGSHGNYGNNGKSGGFSSYINAGQNGNRTARYSSN